MVDQILLKKKYLDWLYELDYNKKPINNLEALLKEAIKFTEERIQNESKK